MIFNFYVAHLLKIALRSLRLCSGRAFASLKTTSCLIAKQTGGGQFASLPQEAIELRSMTPVRDAVPHERLRSLAKFETYAALLGPLPSRVFSTPAPMLTLICFGLASAFLGNAIFNTPLS